VWVFTLKDEQQMNTVLYRWGRGLYNESEMLLICITGFIVNSAVNRLSRLIHILCKHDKCLMPRTSVLRTDFVALSAVD